MSVPTVFLSAAEASGDEHAARLIAALRRRRPDVRLVGVGGDGMAAAGCEIIADPTHRASMGGGPFLQVPYWYGMVRRARKAIRSIRPDVHIPVDSPALNWHLAKSAKRAGAKVLYYVAPQVWAWATWRVRKLARLTDQVACILPFEERYLRDRGVNARYVGHPLFDDCPPRPAELPDLAAAWYSGAWRVALLPGSRPGEIKGHAGALLACADAIRRRWPKSTCVFSVRSEPCAERLRDACGGSDIDIAVAQTRQTLAQSHFAVTASGTVTLEVAHFGVPMVIFYRVSRFNYAVVGRWLLNLPYLSLVNILAGRRLVPELMPWHGNKQAVTRAVLESLEDFGALCETRKALMELTEPLRVPPPATASDNAARLVADMLDGASKK